MNEQIFDIARQSGATNEQGQRAETVFCFTKDELGEFTKRIVRECINEIHVADIGDLKAKGYYLDKVAEHLEKHFGVEE